MTPARLPRIGVDLGGTKTEIVALDGDGRQVLRRRRPTPYEDYRAIVASIAGMVEEAERDLGTPGCTVGVGIPGSLNPATGLVRNGNTQALNGQPLDRDLRAALGRERVRVVNDANCLALSEAADGAGAGHGVVFAVILGTGVGAGVVVHGRVLDGPNRVAGEWGHNPLPWMSDEEHAARPTCWCGQRACLETYLSGPALARDCDGPGARDAGAVERRAADGDPLADAALARHADRLGRALAAVVNTLDPDAVVLGGGLSNMPHLYETVPALAAPHIFGDSKRVNLLRAVHGDSSGVLGAARLWDHDG